jgi:hypothetical protein
MMVSREEYSIEGNENNDAEEDMMLSEIQWMFPDVSPWIFLTADGEWKCDTGVKHARTAPQDRRITRISSNESVPHLGLT